MPVDDFMWKILVGGDGGVGKTTILHRYLHDEFMMDTKMTLGVQFHVQHLSHAGFNIGLSMWDLGGQDRWRFMLPSYCKGAAGAFILFDMTRFETLLNVQKWHAMFVEQIPDMPVMLVGTKYDAIPETDQADMIEKGNEMAARLGCAGYATTSSKYGYNVTETILFLINVILAREGKIPAA